MLTSFLFLGSNKPKIETVEKIVTTIRSNPSDVKINAAAASTLLSLATKPVMIIKSQDTEIPKSSENTKKTDLKSDETETTRPTVTIKAKGVGSKPIYLKPTEHKCQLCAKVFTFPKFLEKHIETVHKKGENIDSSEDTPTKTSKYEFAKTPRIITNQAQLDEIMGKSGTVTVPKSKKISKQKINRTTPKPTEYKCHLCARVCTSPAFLEKHIEDVHKIKCITPKREIQMNTQTITSTPVKIQTNTQATTSTPPVKIKKEIQITNYRCKFCDKNFALGGFYHLKLHIESFHGIKDYDFSKHQTKETGKKEYQIFFVDID